MIEHVWRIGADAVRLVKDVDGGVWTAYYGVGDGAGVMARAPHFGAILEAVLEVLGMAAPSVYIFLP